MHVNSVRNIQHHTGPSLTLTWYMLFENTGGSFTSKMLMVSTYRSSACLFREVGRPSIFPSVRPSTTNAGKNSIVYTDWVSKSSVTPFVSLTECAVKT